SGEGVEAVLAHLARASRKSPPPPRRAPPALESVARSTARQNQAGRIHASVTKSRVNTHSLTDRLDRFVLHPVAGPLLFLAVVLVVFQSIFSGAKPAMDGLEWLFTGFGHLLQSWLPDNLLRSFLIDGVVSGVGAVVVFLPQILVLFFFIALLEHTGYMARAAMVMDRVMSGVGLQGKSFLPLVSSFACAVPGIMATRTIENRRDRIATLFIAPFMTCSARLPVYALLIGAFVPDRYFFHGLLGWKALTLLGLYFAGFAAAMATAALLKTTILKSDRMPFVMEVPPYRAPAIKTILLLMWDRSRMFLRRAGTIILGVNLLLWFLVSFPQPEAKASIRDSYAGKVGVYIEPAIKPLGFDWKIGVGLLSAQAAREVIVSTLATIYHVEESDHSQGLRAVLQKEMTPLIALSLMIFFAFSLQCTSTLAVIRRETGHWGWPVLIFVYMNLLAYLSSLAVFQAGRALGFG
ncbi:MAG: ferrous iron transport protein B, partial [Spirochaetes bacterium]|nr:ferrous iron transport protein B [Spirochaetota bacterium]